jgi:hypothetical protein
MTATNRNPADIFLNLIVTFLTPMFLATTAGDLALARGAAIETVNAYTARNPSDLLLIAQTIALGLAVLSSVSLSMAENIPINLILRLRGNAASLHRAADKSRRALPEAAPAPTATHSPPSDIDRETEEAIIAEVARTQQRVAAYQASFAAEPPPSPEALLFPNGEFPDSTAKMKAAMNAVLTDSERHIAEAAAQNPPARTPAPRKAPMTVADAHRSAWSAAMADVGAEMAAEFATLPLAERRAAGIRLEALSTTANHLISGKPLP